MNKKAIISKEVLEDMVAVCPSNRKQILDRADKYINKYRDVILSSMFEAGRGLAIINNAKVTPLTKHKRDLKEISNIEKAALKFRNMLPESKDLKKGRPLNGSAAHIRKMLHRHDYRFKDLGAAAGQARLENWKDFLEALDEHILIFTEIKKSLESQAVFMKDKRSGPKATTEMLSKYAEQIAQLYEYSTQKKFTYSNPRDGLSDGTLFVQASMPAFYDFLKGIFPKQDKVVRYTDSKILNACDYISRGRDSFRKSNKSSKISHD